jgi:hypothetical protein
LEWAEDWIVYKDKTYETFWYYAVHELGITDPPKMAQFSKELHQLGVKTVRCSEEIEGVRPRGYLNVTLSEEGLHVLLDRLKAEGYSDELIVNTAKNKGGPPGHGFQDALTAM